MKIFTCPTCGNRVYFDNMVCACSQEVAFDVDRQAMEPATFVCANRTAINCNWKADAGAELCRSCAMTEVVPDASVPENVPLWERSERAKRWVLANLARWNWLTAADQGPRPRFRLLSEQTSGGEEAVTMGHEDGVISINVAEASDPTRVLRREQFDERYRTMVGHFRHEIAHFLFMRLRERPVFLDAFREQFGDERADYAEALERHYEAPSEPEDDHVTSYAGAHPHEDWAETAAHAMHLTDLVDSLAATGLALPEGPQPGYDPYAESDTERLVSLAVDVALAVNHVNRSLDLPDLYPFVLSPQVRTKLAFAHRWLKRDA